MITSGTLTFLFTDIEQSSRLWDESPEPMRQALTTHNEILIGAIGDHGGTIVKDRGDGFLAVFASAPDACEAALLAQRGLAGAAWDEAIGPLRVRMALHSGTAEARDGDYFGPEVNRAARLEAAAHGGQMLISEATRALAQEGLPDGVTFRDLGFHSLRGLTRPERIYQLIAPDLPADFPPLRTVGGARSSFPTFPTSFVGRTDEVARIASQLLDADTRALTLLGPGGVGKTRLAVETANQLAPEFLGGTAFADLVRVADPEGIPLAVAQAIGAHPEGSAPVLDIVVSEISDPTLLVLDNWEHLKEGSPVIAELIGRCPDLTLLVTSRTPLHIRGEIIHQLEPLGVTSENGATPAAVDLFIDRAAEHGVEIAVDGPDGEAVRSICRRLDGLPLAIELAAAGVRLLSPTELDRRLGESLALVGSGAVDLPERQRTIQSTIDWSVETLTPDQRTLFNRLSVFPAGATLTQVEQVAAVGLDGDALELMSALVDNSLVTVSSNLPGGTRFGQLTVLREHAANGLEEAGDTELTRSRMIDYYLTAAPLFAAAMDRDESPMWDAETDHPNLAAAMRWSLVAGRTTEMANASYTIWPYWFNGDRAAEAATWAEEADQVASSPELDWLGGFFAFQKGDFETAADRFHRAMTGFIEAGDISGMNMTRTFAATLGEDPGENEAMLQEALTYFEEEGRTIAHYVAGIFIGVNIAMTGDQERALELRLSNLAESDRLEYPMLTGWSDWNVAVSMLSFQRWDEAAAHSRLTLKIMVERNYHEGIASAAFLIAVVDANQGRGERAAMIIGACNAIFDRIGIAVWFEAAAYVAEVVASLRDQFGDAEFDRLETEGRALGVDELVELIESG